MYMIIPTIYLIELSLHWLLLLSIIIRSENWLLMNFSLFKACKCSDTKCTLDNLSAGVEYCVRIAPYRITSTGELPGPCSSNIKFTTLSEEQVVVNKPAATTLHKSHSLYYSLGKLSALPSKYSSYMYVIAVMILGIFISFGIACFL